MMKANKRYMLVSISYILWISCLESNLLNCDKIRNGKFYYYAKHTRERINVLRTDSLQVETGVQEGGSPIKSRIVWKGACKYDMFLNALSDTKLSETDSIIAVTPARVQIISIENHYYICDVKLSVFNKDIELRDTIYYEN